MATCTRLAVLLLVASVSCASPSTPPHILLVLADDYGWSNIGYHRAASLPEDPTLAKQALAEVNTPTLDQLSHQGVRLERHYAYKICAPSRSSLQSGRFSIHVNAENTSPIVHNPEDPVSGYAGIPRNMTGLAQKMKEAGYRTAMVGKWDVGMATPQHTPQGRGYDEWYGYYQHANHYWTKGMSMQACGEVDLCLNRFTDLSEANGTYRGGVQDSTALSSSCSHDTTPDPSCYEEFLFKQRALQIIENHPTEPGSAPLFLFYAFHLLHTPLQVPLATLEELDQLVVQRGGSVIQDRNRRLYAAMTLYMDQTVDALVKALDQKNMWDNSLMVFLSDNGGPVYEPGSGNNHPHRGGKYSDFEGGVRTNAFLSGGFVPEARRGTVFDGVINIADWYSTFCGLAGVDPEDHAAKAANPWLKERGLPTLFPVDGVDQWPAIMSGKNARTGAFPLSSSSLMEWPYKLIVGTQPYSMYTGHLYPNCSTVSGVMENGPVFIDLKVFDTRVDYNSNKTEQDRVSFVHDCSNGCLFDVSADPEERADLAQNPDYKEVFQRLSTELSEVKVFSPDRGSMSVEACHAGVENGGYYGPFVDIDGFYTNVPSKGVFQRLKDQAYLQLIKGITPTGRQQIVVDGFKAVYESKIGHRVSFGNIDSCTKKSDLDSRL